MRASQIRGLADPIEKQSDWPLYSLFFLLLGSRFLPPELIGGMNAYFLILALMVWISKTQAFPKSLWVVLSCFTGMIAVGMLSGLDNELYPYLKDGWYFITPVATLFVGYCFGAQTPSLRDALRILVIVGVILAIVHLAKFVVNPSLLTMSATEVRSKAGAGDLAVDLTCALLVARIGRWRESLAIWPGFGWLALVICGASMSLAYSRTSVLVAVIFWMAIRGLMVGPRFVKLVIVAILAVTVFGTISNYLPQTTEIERKTFTGKVLHSVQELEVDDYLDRQSINDNFRGFETARALKAYVDGGVLGWVVGRGFGHLVDLGLSLVLGEGPLRYIPVLHNGIMYVLVKTGALGLALYLTAFGWLFRLGSRAARSNDLDERFAGHIVQGTVAVSLVTSWLISGPFNKSELVPVLLLLGICLSIVERKEWKR
jgi:hypothetical protein